MGKSDNKVRADSINNLRKRYDAFLEEDRKRKERNEDILNKLDKMRSSVTRYKANIYLDQRLPTNIFRDAHKSPVRRNNEPQISTELDIRRPHIDETLLLSQISKKYILIPKLRSVDINDYAPRAIQQDNNNDNDWKSKYSILDKLKQNEKEETINSSAYNEINLRNNENLSTGLPKYQEDDKPVKLSTKRDNTESTKKDFAVNEFAPIKSSQPQNHAAVTFNDYNVNDPKSTPEQTQKQPLHKSAVPNAREHNTLKAETEFTKMNEYADSNFRAGMDEHDQQQPKTEASFVVAEAPVKNDLAADDRDQIESVPYVADQQNHFVETIDKHETENTEKSYPGNKDMSHAAAFHPEPSYPSEEVSQAASFQPEKSYPGDDDITHVEILNPDELVQEITNENVNTGGSQEANYPIDIINVQEFTPGSDVNLVEGVNINPEGQYIPPSHQYGPETVVMAEQEKEGTYQDPVYTDEQVTNEGNYDPSQQYESTGNVDNMDITAGIQEFETEQNEMYYSEQANAQYDQYNQEDVAEGYNAEYTGGTEGYDQAYYEGTQQEGAYPAEVNEHEETSQRYDLNYGQQYATTGEENQYAEQPQNQQEHLDVSEQTGDAAAQEYEHAQYEAQPQEIAEHVEQQLDLEDGYYEQNSAGNIGNVAGTAALYQEATPDQTLEQNLENLAIPAVET